MKIENYYILFNNLKEFLKTDLSFDSNLLNVKKFSNLESALNFNNTYYNNNLFVFHFNLKIDYNSLCLIDESLWYDIDDHFE